MATTSNTAIRDRILEQVADCRGNDVDYVDLVREWANCREAEVDDEGYVWIADPQVGHSLSDEKLEELADWIEAS